MKRPSTPVLKLSAGIASLAIVGVLSVSTLMSGSKPSAEDEYWIPSTGALIMPPQDLQAQYPLRHAKQTPLDATLWLDFNAPITVNPTTAKPEFTLSLGTEKISGKTTIEGNRISFEPEVVLESSRIYSARVDNVSLDDSITPQESYAWDFYTEGNGWSMHHVDQDDSDATLSDVNVSMNNRGEGLAAWREIGENNYTLKSKKFHPLTGWKESVEFYLSDGVAVGPPSTGITNDGTSTVVWGKMGESRTGIWSSGYDTSSWDMPKAIDPNSPWPAFEPQVVSNSRGDTIAVWRQFDGLSYRIVGSFRTAQGSWGPSETIETDAGGDAFTPSIGMDNNGNAVAVWDHHMNMSTQVVAATYTPASGWSVAENIEVPDKGNANRPTVSVNGAGYAVAVWRQADGGGQSIWANVYSPINGWQGATLIEKQRNDALRPTIYLSDSGNATAIWEQTTSGETEIWANHFGINGWGQEFKISDLGNKASYPVITGDGRGGMTALWQVEIGSIYNIAFSHFEPAIGWSANEILASSEFPFSSHPKLSSDGQGNAIAVWVSGHQDKTTQITFAHFNRSIPLW